MPYQVRQCSHALDTLQDQLANKTTELKATLDDHVPIFLTSPNTPSNQPLPKSARFQPSYTLTYIRLGLGYVAVVIALYIFYLDYILKKDWKETKWIVWIGVPIYFALSSALTLFQWFVEKGVIFEGTRSEPGGSTTALRVASNAPSSKYDPVYNVTVSWTVSGGAGKSGSLSLTTPMTKFFTSDGFFSPSDFEAWLKHEIPVVAMPAQQLGKTTVVEAKEAELLDEGDAEDVDAAGQVIQSQRGDTIVLSSSTSPKKRGRPRKSQG